MEMQELPVRMGYPAQQVDPVWMVFLECPDEEELEENLELPVTTVNLAYPANSLTEMPEVTVHQEKTETPDSPDDPDSEETEALPVLLATTVTLVPQVLLETEDRTEHQVLWEIWVTLDFRAETATLADLA